MDIQQGNPPGYDTRRNRGEYKTEGARMQEKQQQSLDELYRSLPPNSIKGTPLQYGDDGLPLVDDPQQFPEQAQAQSLESQIQTTANQADPVAAKFFAPRQNQPQQQQRSQRPQPQPQAPQQMSQGSLQYHPVLKRMLGAFGLKKAARHQLELYTDEVGKIVYTMTLVSEELQSWAMLESKNKFLGEAELAAVYFELLYGCCSVVAIDNVPLWQLFNLRLADGEEISLQEDPLEMNSRLRRTCSRMLADLLWTETVPIGEKLLQFYQEKVMGKKIQSSLDKDIFEKVRYVCPLDDCDNYEFFTPAIENGAEKKYFCKFHGIQLVKTVDILKELDVPLG
jgi:hypothetical protein